MKLKKGNESKKRKTGGKNVKIKIIKQLHGAWASWDNKTITINEKTKKTLTKKELESVLYHEQGHFTFWNNFFKYLPIIGMLLAIFYLFFKYNEQIFELLLIKLQVIQVFGILGLFLVVLFIISILEFPFAWIREILADWHTVKRTKGSLFRKTLCYFYEYNKKNSKWTLKRLYDGVILHPPLSLRLWIIKLMEKLRDKKEDL